jgi:hypothetical protein
LWESVVEPGIILTLAIVAIALFWERRRTRAKEAELERWKAMTPGERSKANSDRQRSRLLAEASPEERPAILERFAFLDSIENLSSAEKDAAYAKWSASRRPQGPALLVRPMLEASPRRPTPSTQTEDTIYSRRTVVWALRRELPGALAGLTEGGLGPVAIAHAAVDAGMSIFGRYPRISTGSGGVMDEGGARAMVIEVLVDTLAQQDREKGQPLLDPDTRLAIESYDASEGDSATGLAILVSILQGTADEALAARMASWPDRPWGSPWTGHDEVMTAADAVTEIGLTRGMCRGPCPAYTVTLRRNGSAEFVGEHFVERLGQHVSDLEPESFDTLARAVMFLCLASPNRVDESFMQYVLDVPHTSVWILRTGERVEAGHYSGVGDRTTSRLGMLIDSVTSDMAWRPADAS